MKFPLKLLLAIVAVCFASPVFGQTVSVSGSLKDITTGSVTSNVQVDFELQNYGGQIPHVAANGTIVQVKKSFRPNASGLISGTLYPDSVITPAGTFYKVCILIQGAILRCNNYLINADFNLNSAVPLDITPVIGPSQFIVECKGFEFLTPSVTWTLPHNFSDANVWGNAFETTGNQSFPDTTTKTNSNTLTMTWVNPKAGHGLACHAGAVNIATNQPNAIVSNPAGTQVIPGALTVSASTVFSGSNTHTGPETFANINNILWVDGTQYATCNTALAALGSNPGIVIIPSTYAGADCATTSVDGTNEVLPAANQQVWDLRGPTGSTAYPVAWNSSAFGQNSKLGVLSYTNGGSATVSAIHSKQQITGSLTTMGTATAVAAKTDVTGTISGSMANQVSGLFAETHIRSVGSTIPSANGVVADVNIDRASATTLITQASAFRASPCSNSSTSGAVIAECYGLYADRNTAGTANYSIYSLGQTRFGFPSATDNGIAFNTTAGAPLGVMRNDGADILEFRPLNDTNGIAFRKLDGVTNNLLIGVNGVPVQAASFSFNENSAPAGIASSDLCYGDSSAHALKCKYNNGSPGQVLLDNNILINSAPTGSNLQGTDTKLLSAGTVSGTAAPLCTSANGGATTVGCPTAVTIRTGSASGCTTGNNTYDTCDTTVNWNSSFADTTYTPTCMGTSPTNPRAMIQGWISKSTTSVVVRTVTEGAAAVGFATITCIGAHL